MKSPFCDPALVRNPEAYGRLTRQFMDGGVCRLGPARRRTGSIFFVAKKSGCQMLVLDARLVNVAFRLPLRANLPSWSTDELGIEDAFYIAHSDVSDAFCRIWLPEGLNEHIVLLKRRCSQIPS